MRMITDDNRDIVQAKYIEHIIAHLDFMQVREMLRSYLHREKDEYTNFELECEIRKDAHEVLYEQFEDILKIGG